MPWPDNVCIWLFNIQASLNSSIQSKSPGSYIAWMAAVKTSPCPGSFLKETSKMSFMGPGSATPCATHFTMTLSCMILWDKHETAPLLSGQFLPEMEKSPHRYKLSRVKGKCELPRDVAFGKKTFCSYAFWPCSTKWFNWALPWSVMWVPPAPGGTLQQFQFCRCFAPLRPRATHEYFIRSWSVEAWVEMQIRWAVVGGLVLLVTRASVS